MKLGDRVEMITGGGSGMGHAMSLLFTVNGTRLLSSTSTNLRPGDCRFHRHVAGQAIALQRDVIKRQFDGAAVAPATQSLGPINILCSNAGCT